MRNNPNPRLYTLYVNGKPVSNHSYEYVTAVIVFKERFFSARKEGKKVVIDTARRGRKFVA